MLARRFRIWGRACGVALIAALACGASASAQQSGRNQTAPGGTNAWQTVCPTLDGERRCVVYAQNGGATRVGTVAARVSVGRRGAAGANVVVVDIGTPVLQERGFGLGIDANRPLVATIVQCDQIACRGIITGAAADALVDQFRKGREATVAYYAEDRVPVRIRISLQGFTAAYRALPRSRG
ncbi:MAG: invasion associated locus B family protein [Alphaproteobacteria bacterium]